MNGRISAALVSVYLWAALHQCNKLVFVIQVRALFRTKVSWHRSGRRHQKIEERKQGGQGKWSRIPSVQRGHIVDSRIDRAAYRAIRDRRRRRIRVVFTGENSVHWLGLPVQNQGRPSGVRKTQPFAQPLGRMVRTPLQCRCSRGWLPLNDAAIPSVFSNDTVQKVIDELVGNRREIPDDGMPSCRWWISLRSRTMIHGRFTTSERKRKTDGVSAVEHIWLSEWFKKSSLWHLPQQLAICQIWVVAVNHVE